LAFSSHASEAHRLTLMLFFSASQNLLHLLPLSQFIYQLIEVPYFLGEGVGDFLHPVTANYSSN